MSTKTFDILPEMIMEYLMEDFCTNNEGFDQIYLNADSKTQSMEKLGLDLIFFDNFR